MLRRLSMWRLHRSLRGNIAPTPSAEIRWKAHHRNRRLSDKTNCGAESSAVGGSFNPRLRRLSVMHFRSLDSQTGCAGLT